MPISSCTHMRQLSVYIHNMNSVQSTVSPQTLVYIYFTLLTNVSEQICLPHCICMSYCITTVVYIRLHFTAYISKTSKAVGFELNSNMPMYYAFDNHIYSISSVTTYIFLDLKTFFSAFLPMTLDSVHTCV